VTRTVIDGKTAYSPDQGVRGVDDAELESVGEASAELWDRL